MTLLKLSQSVTTIFSQDQDSSDCMEKEEGDPKITTRSKMQTGPKYVLIQLSNLLIVGLAALPILLFAQMGKPFEKGFFCNDKAISHPYKSSTVTSTVLYLTMFLIPAAFVLAGEFIITREQERKHTLIFGRYVLHIPKIFINFLEIYLGYLLGAAISQTLVDLSKYSVGRLRPHFLEVCQPNWENIDCGTDIRPKFVTNYTCLGNFNLFPEEKERLHRLRESRLSFVSGHASVTSETMTFCILYLQARLAQKISPSYLIPLVQAICFCFALFTGLSRVSDYKHHAGDVLAGGFIGFFVQFLNVIFIMRLFRRTKDEQCHDKIGMSNENDVENETYGLRNSVVGSATRVYHATENGTQSRQP